MKVFLISVFAIVILGVLVVGGKSDSQSSTSSRKDVSIQQIRTNVASGGQLIDVRTPAEFSAGHIDGAINLPLQDIQAGSVPAAAKDKPVYVYCHSGNRSRQAATALKTAGFTNIIDLGAMTHVESIGGTIKST